MTQESTELVPIRKYKEKDLGIIVKRHRELYENEYGFGEEFGDYVEKYLIQFHDSSHIDKGEIWIAEVDGKFAGVIAIVKADMQTAQLRWFLVEPEMRGKGIGNVLMKTAIDYCAQRGYQCVILWTVSVLEAARYLYQKFGFTLAQTKENKTWGDGIIEERWDLQIKGDVVS